MIPTRTLSSVLSALTLTVYALLCLPIAAQSNTKQQPTSPDTVVRHPSAWTLTTPLGSHRQSAIDTALYNYQRQAIPSMVSDAMLTTGNLGGASQTLIYMDRPQGWPLLFTPSMMPWMKLGYNQRFYNVYIPMTLVSYNFGGNRDSNQDRLRAEFAGNVNRRIGIGAHIDYLYSKGSYAQQATKDYMYGATFYYMGDRYEMQALWDQNNMLNKDNGGITNDLYITDPAVLQGGVDKIQPKSIPTRLSTAHTRLHTSRFFMTHAYKVGYWKNEQVNDTLTRKVYVPYLRFIYSLDYKRERHLFINSDPTEAREFWSNTYLDLTSTRDRTTTWSLANTVGVEMIEGFRPWVKFGLSAWLTYDYRRYTQTDVPEGLDEPQTEITELTALPFMVPHTASQNLLWLGGKLDKRTGRALRYTAQARFGLMGDVAGDLDLNGEIETRFRLFGDTVSIAASGFFRNEEPGYLLDYYVSNHFTWRNDFGKTRSFQVTGTLSIPWTRTRIEVGMRNTRNLIYFDDLSMPNQYGGSVQVVMARLHQNLQFGIWNWRNTITWQGCSNQNILPLPALAIYSNMFLEFTAFRVLHLQIGVDCDYYTRYKGYLYQPATMTFHLQGADGTPVGNYAFCNAYLTAKLYRARFFVLWSHVNQGWFGSNYFSMPGYPLNPRRLQFGVSIDFAN